jgi:hypothetical protein
VKLSDAVGRKRRRIEELAIEPTHGPLGGLLRELRIHYFDAAEIAAKARQHLHGRKGACMALVRHPHSQQ